METSTARTYLVALEKARTYTPDAQLSKEVILRLAQKGLCIAPNAPSWFKVKCPTVDMTFQFELGMPGNEDTLIVTALNEKIPADEVFPLYSMDYDQIVLPLVSEYYTLEDVVNEIIDFIIEQAPASRTLLSSKLPERIPTLG